MQNYSKVRNFNHKNYDPYQSINPIKINKLICQVRPEDLFTQNAMIRKIHYQQIDQLMKKTQLTYQSIFLVENLFPQESNTHLLEIVKETSETEPVIIQVEKKGFSFLQYPANNPIQDSLCSFFIQQLNAFAVSIFDGHGGSQLSRFCAKNMPEILKKIIKSNLNLQKYKNNKILLLKDSLQQAYSSLQDQYYQNHYRNKIKQDKKKYKGIGTCGITAIMYESKCIVATCGDSQSIVISQDRGSYNYQKLSQRFSVNNKTERQRIIAQFKDIDDKIVVQQRKNVFYLKGMLQPTKSIGDYYLKHKQHYIGQGQFKGPYISHKPEIKVYDIKQHDKYIVMASDGLWDYFTKWQIVKFIIQSKKDKLSLAQRQTQSENQDQNQLHPISTQHYLVDRILEKVADQINQDVSYLKQLQLGERRSYHDDITIATINIKQFFQNIQKKLNQE